MCTDIKSNNHSRRTVFFYCYYWIVQNINTIRNRKAANHAYLYCAHKKNSTNKIYRLCHLRSCLFIPQIRITNVCRIQSDFVEFAFRVTSSKDFFFIKGKWNSAAVCSIVFFVFNFYCLFKTPSAEVTWTICEASHQHARVPMKQYRI